MQQPTPCHLLRPAVVVRLMALTLLLSFACHFNATFDIIESGNAPLAGASSPGTLNFVTLTDIDLAEHPSLKQQGLTLDELQSVTLEDATLAISTPATGGDLSFFSALQLVAQAPGYPDVVVASAAPPIAANNSVLLVPEGTTNLLTYAKTNAFTFVVEAQYSQPPAQSVTLTLEPSLRIVVEQPAGACKHQ